MIKIDNTDRDLIALLRKNSRTPVAVLAKKMKVSRATVQNRMSRLEKHKIISGYTLELSRDLEGKTAPIRAMTSLQIDGDAYKRVTEQLLREPSIVAIHSTNGRWDIIIEIETSSLDAFNETLVRVRDLPEITSSESNLLLSTTRGS